MNDAFGNLTIGLLFAAVFVYLLMVVNYQSFVDPLAVILALPGAGSGILLMLFVTGTTLSVPSLMGAIMSVGVASANSILLVTFAREQRQAGMSAFQAAIIGRHHAVAAGADDGGGDDRGHGADGHRRCRRGAERRAGARGDRRRAGRHGHHAAVRAVSLLGVRRLRAGAYRTGCTPGAEWAGPSGMPS